MSTAVPFRDEAQLQAAVAALATRRYELLHYHTHRSDRSVPGFPDSVFVGRAVLFRELKLHRRSRVSADQQVWIQRLRDAGADAGFWYGEDYHSGLIDEQLRDASLRTGGGHGSSLRRRTQGPPLVMRLAKRLYLKTGDNPARAALLWEAGVASVEHGTWIARAQEILAIVIAELPAGVEEHREWLTGHDLGPGVGVAAIFTALKTDLADVGDASRLLAEPHLRASTTVEDRS